jgi:hypothetical protein
MARDFRIFVRESGIDNGGNWRYAVLDYTGKAVCYSSTLFEANLICDSLNGMTKIKEIVKDY